jgi:phosphoribosylaminoimidazole-succinocarboxamide synthase
MAMQFPTEIRGKAPLNQGKTRDLFSVRPRGGRGDMLHIFATNRLSTHNIVHQSEIPKKGEVLTALTVFWLTEVFNAAQIPHHLVDYGKGIYSWLDEAKVVYPRDAHLRSMIVHKLPVKPVEFIFRARMSGSFYKDYYKKGLPDPYGLNIEPGMELMTKFPEPVFTPTEKSETDDPLHSRTVVFLEADAYKLARNAFVLTRNYLSARNIDLIDGKSEVGVGLDGKPCMIDEICTPDCSRYCLSSDVQIGVEPAWLDKELARIEAVRIWGGGTKVPLIFSSAVVNKLTDTYLGLFESVTGRSLDDFQRHKMN